MFRALGTAVFALAALTASAAAQDWPNRAITLVVPFAAGGGIDTSARVQALALTEILGQVVVIENIGAAGGTIGSARVAKAAPDGYTLLIGNSEAPLFGSALMMPLRTSSRSAWSRNPRAS